MEGYLLEPWVTAGIHGLAATRGIGAIILPIEPAWFHEEHQLAIHEVHCVDDTFRFPLLTTLPHHRLASPLIRQRRQQLAHDSACSQLHDWFSFCICETRCLASVPQGSRRAKDVPATQTLARLGDEPLRR